MGKMKMFNLIVMALLAAVATGCSSAEHPATGQLWETAGERVPAGMVPAVIYTIDGERAFTGRGMHRVIAGEHTVRVWPDRTQADGVATTGTPERFDVESITVDVASGSRYHIAAIVTREVGRPDLPQSARTTIRPVVSRTSDWCIIPQGRCVKTTVR